MQEIDLIPEDFRRGQQLKNHIHAFLLCFAALLLVVVGGKITLNHLVSRDSRHIEQLEAGETFILSQRGRLDELNSLKEILQARQNALEGLRNGPPAAQLFVILGQAINPSAWLTQIKFLRAGEFQAASSGAVATGYFMVVPKNAPDKDENAWRRETHLELRGEALNHSALADFVKTLLSYPEIGDVFILNTRTRNYAFGQTVEYDLAATLTAAAQ